MKDYSKVFLIGAMLYIAHNVMNGFLYGFGLILVITLVPYLIVAAVWKIMNYIVKAVVLVFLAVIEISQVAPNFPGWEIGSISGVLLLGAMMTMLLTAVLVVNDGIAKRALNKKGEHVS